MPLAGVWEILQVKLQQALHFRPLQNLSTGYPSSDDATSSPYLSALSFELAPERARVWKCTRGRNIYAMRSYGTDGFVDTKFDFIQKLIFIRKVESNFRQC